MEVSQLKLDHLRPPKNVHDIIHKGDYMLQIEGKQHIRRIFHDVFYTKYEGDKLVEFKGLIDREQVALPPDWTSEETLKFLHSTQFNIDKSLRHLKTHLNWRANLPQEVPTEAMVEVIKTGAAYISGRDKEHRPIIIIDVLKIKENSIHLQEFLDALSLLLFIAKGYYFVQGKVENWIIIIETGGLGIIDFPFKTLKKVIKHIVINFPSTIEKIYIMNPSRTFKGSWNIIQKTIDALTRSKISTISKAQYPQLLDRIIASQIEKRYGGTLKDFENYWPPTNTISNPFAHMKNYNDSPDQSGSKLDLSEVGEGRESRSQRTSKNEGKHRDRKGSDFLRTHQAGEEEYVDEDEEEETEENAHHYKDTRKVHVSKFKSFQKRSTHLSTIREESYEEGYTSMMQDGSTLRRLSARKSRQKSRKFLSTVLVKQSSERTELSPTSRRQLSVQKEGFESFSFAEPNKFELSLDGKANTPVCCQFEGSRGAESCNIF